MHAGRINCMFFFLTNVTCMHWIQIRVFFIRIEIENTCLLRKYWLNEWWFVFIYVQEFTIT
jgi:hypothetical protein